MNLRPDEPPNGDFVAYVDALVNQSTREHAAQRRELNTPKATKAARKTPAKSAAKPDASAATSTPASMQAAAQAVLQAAREDSAELALGKVKGWLVKGVIGAVALLVVLPMLIDWWDETDDPSSVGIVLVMAVIALRWWLANRRR
jgi:hypothetical protein